MNDISSETPMSGLTATSGASPAIQVLQRVKDLVFQAATEFTEIKSPETACAESIAKVNALLQERFHLLRELRQSGDEQTIQDEIVQYAGDRKILEIHGRADAEKAYSRQIEAVLQRLCDRLIPEMGSAVVKRSLQKLPAGELKQYLPDNLLNSNGGVATELEIVPSSTDLNKPHGPKPIVTVPDPVHSKKRCASHDKDQYPTKKRQINSSLEDLGKREKLIQHPHVADTTIRSSREQRGEVDNSVANPDIIIPQQETEVAITENDSSFEAGFGTASDQPHWHTTTDAVVLPFTGHSMTADEEDQTTTKKTVVVCVNDADNKRIGNIEQIGPWNNRHVDTILQKTIQRPIQIRRGRPFTKQHLAAISDRSDPKGVKMIACMIQVTGDVMNQRCQRCEKNLGIFEECIKVNDELYQRCGNCEWNHQRCHGASINAESVPSSGPSERLRRDRHSPNTMPKFFSALEQRGGTSPAKSQPQNLAEAQLPPRTVDSRPTSPYEVQQLGSVIGMPPIPPLDAHEATRTSHGSHTIPQVERVRDDLQSDGFSEADSYTGAPVTKNDWRIVQVKTRFFTSAQSVTQYWSWVDEEEYFEHQVLKETSPVQWGVLREPIDFNVQLREIKEVRYNAKALRVHLVMTKENATISTQDGAPRGDVMVVFKSERTVRRFVSFCHKRSVPIAEQKPNIMVSAWRGMKSEVALSDDDDDDTN